MWYHMLAIYIKVYLGIASIFSEMYTERHSSLLPYVFTVRTLRSNGQSLHRKSHPSLEAPKETQNWHESTATQETIDFESFFQFLTDWIHSAMDSCFDLRFLLFLFSWQWSMRSSFCLRLRTLAAKQWMALSVEATGISTFEKTKIFDFHLQTVFARLALS